jgi:hypothetical protein
MTDVSEARDEVAAEVHEPTGITFVRQDKVWSPSQIALIAAGAVFIVFGLVAMIKGGLGGAINEPSVQVFSFAHTPLLGVIELGAGVLLLVAGLVPGARTLGMLLGALLGIAGGLLLADLEWSRRYLTTDPDFGWILVGVGAAIVLIVGLVPSIRSQKTTWS